MDRTNCGIILFKESQQLWRSLISTCLELNQPVDEELKEGGRSSSPPRKVPRTEEGR